MKRKLKFNENYFEKIDSEQKAYFLGLFYADSCVHAKCNSTSISLQKKDINILKKLNKLMNSNVPFCISYLSKQNPNHQDSYKLTFTSKKMQDDLKRVGCVPRKSLILTFPSEKQVPNHLIRHFIRGYYDGDGWVGSRCRGKTEFIILTQITSTKIFLEAMMEILAENGIKTAFKKLYALIKKGNNTTHSLITTTNTWTIRFLDWIYQDSTVYLKRKYKKYISLKKKLYKIRGLDENSSY